MHTHTQTHRKSSLITPTEDDSNFISLEGEGGNRTKLSEKRHHIHPAERHFLPEE